MPTTWQWGQTIFCNYQTTESVAPTHGQAVGMCYGRKRKIKRLTGALPKLDLDEQFRINNVPDIAFVF